MEYYSFFGCRHCLDCDFAEQLRAPTSNHTPEDTTLRDTQLGQEPAFGTWFLIEKNAFQNAWSACHSLNMASDGVSPSLFPWVIIIAQFKA